MIALVDYGAGNVRSVEKALRFVGADVALTADPERVRAAERVVFPGQGHFGQSMAALRHSGLDAALRDMAESGRPFLGICLGLQLLYEGSEEAPGVAGLGLLPGTCRRFGADLKVPQIGWNRVDRRQPGTPLDALDDGGHFYFVHSYHAPMAEGGAADPVCATATYGAPFPAAVRQGALFATQFHPEKSGQLGLALLRAWLAEDAPC